MKMCQNKSNPYVTRSLIATPASRLMHAELVEYIQSAGEVWADILDAQAGNPVRLLIGILVSGVCKRIDDTGPRRCVDLEGRWSVIVIVVVCHKGHVAVLGHVPGPTKDLLIAAQHHLIR